ncbi:FAD-dependent monooxygenase [Streptomyces sp. PmtG]
MQGMALLNRWGLLDKLRDAGCKKITRQRYEGPGVSVAGFSLPLDGLNYTYAPRRYVLDPVLAEGAVEAGVDFQEGCAVNDLVYEDDRVVGVRYTTPEGTQTTERARLVVGADGMRSLVARKVGAPNVIEHPRVSCTYYSYWSGVPSDFELYERPGRWIRRHPHQRRPHAAHDLLPAGPVQRRPQGSGALLPRQLQQHGTRPLRADAGGQARGAAVRHGPPGELLPQGLRPRLGACR